MHYFNDNLSPLVKIILVAVIILEIGWISIKDYSNLSDYITWVLLIISFPTTYYLYQYIRCKYQLAQDVGEYNPKKVMVGEELDSNQEVSKLIKKPEYRQYEANKHREIGVGHVQRTEDEKRKEREREKQILDIIGELEEKEGQIFGQ